MSRASPLAVIYCDSCAEVTSVLELLAAKPEWEEIEARRIEAAGGIERSPRRPGTNAFFDAAGREWRTLCYNDVPGYSESEAARPDWRARKKGTSSWKRMLGR